MSEFPDKDDVFEALVIDREANHKRIALLEEMLSEVLNEPYIGETPCGDRIKMVLHPDPQPIHPVTAIKRRLRKMEVAIDSTLVNNGGPIDADETVDGVAYVMVRRVDFDALEAARKSQP